MTGRTHPKIGTKPDLAADGEYLSCIGDLIAHPLVLSMKNYIQHGNTDCLGHCLYVSYTGYLLCRRLGLDHRSAARGGLLHDFFLYDWHQKGSSGGLHGFTHPRTALRNADGHFDLGAVEKDIIAKHMWPMTLTPPLYKETLIIIAADKYCALREIFGARRNRSAEAASPGAPVFTAAEGQNPV